MANSTVWLRSPHTERYLPEFISLQNPRVASLAMRLELQPVTDTGFAEVVAGMWTSFENPFSGLLRVVAPILNDDRAASFATNIQVQLAQHKATQPESHWIKVVDLDAGGELAGAARWLVYERDPFKEGEEVVADWWPEGFDGERVCDENTSAAGCTEGKDGQKTAFISKCRIHPPCISKTRGWPQC
ncbi:hypothetical protein CIHG_09366 [Coccidioides immitis H538.4]|uniref:N-acetyltransferase domain-containing protein n=1 Tax=Coccidioides immitis H538.4 TaxID=396776 RepID=A0A0J8S402_COCIT|nr:hypothetical protein CIHG_09366 [Coccidioides immitis H538.4]